MAHRGTKNSCGECDNEVLTGSEDLWVCYWCNKEFCSNDCKENHSCEKRDKFQKAWDETPPLEEEEEEKEDESSKDDRRIDDV
ncbi:MAG: hypothetical protein O3C40_31785 [Planctomycetota bacterium]|nr:hypothetical protein [Planctomycetota bacterium]